MRVKTEQYNHKSAMQIARKRPDLQRFLNVLLDVDHRINALHQDIDCMVTMGFDLETELTMDYDECYSIPLVRQTIINPTIAINHDRYDIAPQPPLPCFNVGSSPAYINVDWVRIVQEKESGDGHNYAIVFEVAPPETPPSQYMIDFFTDGKPLGQDYCILKNREDK